MKTVPRPGPTKGRTIRDASEPVGGFTTLDGEAFYRITAVDRMPPFLMSIASDTDLWMFITSRGGLTAGRGDAEGSLFPYETADKLNDGHHHTGPITLLRVHRSNRGEALWAPFANAHLQGLPVERNLYKSTIGNQVVFEETHRDLGLSFRYRWAACDEYGWVRTATLVNRGTEPVSLSVLDGLRNVLPHGAALALYQQSSSLVDAYKRVDLDPETGLGIFSLTARIIDRAEPAEALMANTIWSRGLERVALRASIETIDAFRSGEPLHDETLLTGRRGNYLVCADLTLEPGAESKWQIVADVGRSHVQIADLHARLRSKTSLDRELQASVSRAGENLIRIVASADGLQHTAHAEMNAHHFANVLFNSMRGGVFANQYQLPTADFVDFLETRNRPVAKRHGGFHRELAVDVSALDLRAATEQCDDPDLQRITLEYLPIYFGRRHGDPSRPWNRFSIRVRNEDGGRALRYEGNWRDIFQNWEGLSLAFPAFLPHFVAKFVNASTVDGFNPYRVTRDGVDWEVADPDDPWSYIGYWGDHQIIYLLKFLEALPRYLPGEFERLLEREIFSYADVPYRIRPYRELVANPRDTIVFDGERAARIDDRVSAMGTDGKLLPSGRIGIEHVNLLEKLVVSALSKLSNLVPDGGIWMNTQRPEWNDANNALVGNGVSMVTLCYLRRYLRFLEHTLEGLGDGTRRMSIEVVEWLQAVRSVLERHGMRLTAPAMSDRDRRQMLDELGEAFSTYREKVYDLGFSGKTTIPNAEIRALCRIGLEHLEHAIRANRRDDGLYHAYSLIELSESGREASLRRLYEMLEGQVAVLSSGLVDVREAVQLVSTLFESRLFRRDQRSFLLYPARELPAFLDRNRVPGARAREIPLLKGLLAAGERSIIARDATGTFRFHGTFANANDLAAALERLAEKKQWRDAVARDQQAVLDLFEDVFDHHSFTGRSGTMYGYEGLGCIYWHMVAKLLLAVQEIIVRGSAKNAGGSQVAALAKLYERIRSGLGFEKTALEYGAFPTDPYSHTPAHGGAQQPGMTGQVKEEILTRFGELGVRVEGGCVQFRPVLLQRREFLNEPGTFRGWNPSGQRVSIEVPAGGLAFTLCQVPVVYHQSADGAWIRIVERDVAAEKREGDRMDPERSRMLFVRSGAISRIDVGVPTSALRP